MPLRLEYNHMASSGKAATCESSSRKIHAYDEDVRPPSSDQQQVLCTDSLLCIEAMKLPAKSDLLSQNSTTNNEVNLGHYLFFSSNEINKSRLTETADKAAISAQSDDKKEHILCSDVPDSALYHGVANGSSAKHVLIADQEKEWQHQEHGSNQEVSPPSGTVAARSHKKQPKVSGPNLQENVATFRSFLPRDAKAKTHYSSTDGDSSSRNASINDVGSDSPSGLEISVISRLDDSAYDKSLLYDAIDLFTSFVFPNSFPWYDPKFSLEMTSPFDIEDLPAVLQATGDRETSALSFTTRKKIGRKGKAANRWQRYQESLASFGFGRYETGRSRRPRGKRESASVLCAGNVNCAARRGDQPGVIDFVVRLVPPPQEIELDCNDKVRAPEDIPHLVSYTSDQRNQDQLKLAEFFESVSTLPWTSPWEAPNPSLVDGSMRSKKRFQSIEDYMKRGITVKRYKLSVRVEGVSSRSTLLCQPPESTGMLQSNQALTALLPPSISSGKPVLCSGQSDITAASLGSYDVQHPLMQGNKKAKGHFGRGRLVWSEPFFGAQGGVAYRSNLSFQLMESSQSHKRPRQVRVGVCIDGAPFHRSDNDKGSYRKKICQRSQCVDEEHVDFPDWSNATCTLNHKNYLSAQMKNPKRNPDPEFLGSKDDGDELVKYTPPNLISLPCNEGSFRVVCLKPGMLAGINVHELILNATKRFRKKNGLGSTVCSICWTGNIFDKETKRHANVFDCVDCALPAHLECCFDSGVFLDEPHKTVWRCAVCRDYYATGNSASSENLELMLQNESTETASYELSPAKDNKPKRRSKIPERYNTDSYTAITSNRRRSSPRTRSDSVEPPVSGRVTQENIEKTDYVRPAHKCSLCPHFGGAMSKFNNSVKDVEDQWAHEICRVWCQPTGDHVQRSCAPVFQAETACAICGVGGSGRTKKPTGAAAGLTKCAANGCHIFFHPMCAMLVSRVPSSPENRVEHVASTGEGKKNLSFDLKARSLCNNAIDAELASQYTFHYLSDTVKETKTRYPYEEIQEVVVPVSFCGWHNPGRALSLFGCPPITSVTIQSNSMLNWIKIPPCITEFDLNEKEGASVKRKVKTAKAK